MSCQSPGNRPGVSDRLVARDRLTGTGRVGGAMGGPGRGSGSVARQASRDASRNNVFADRDGNLYRRDARGNWQERTGNRWADLSGADRAQVRTDRGGLPQAARDAGRPDRIRQDAVSRPSQPVQRGDKDRLNRDFSSRYRGVESAAILFIRIVLSAISACSAVKYF